MGQLRENIARRNRYTRQPSDTTILLTPEILTLLLLVARYGIGSLPQLALRTGLSTRQVRRRMRALFDTGLVDVVACTRAAVADVEAAHDPSLVYGSAPNLYIPTAAGLRQLTQRGLMKTVHRPARVNAKSALFLAHSLFVTDVRIWLERSAEIGTGEELRLWRAGADAAITLDTHAGRLYPDAWFTYGLGSRVLVGFVEVDRSTERGTSPVRWREKLAAYESLFMSDRIKEITGYANARLLVVTSSARRRDSLATFLAQQASPELAAQVWLAERSVLSTPGFMPPTWRRPGAPEFLSLLPVTADSSG